MLKKFLFGLTLLFLAFLIPPKVHAIENPLASPNNFFGIHIHDENDLDDAAKLVNSSGGDWGYVTLAIPKGDRNLARWQATFDRMRRLHLIPIVRLATQEQNGGWEKGKIDEIPGWADFLNNLNWVVKNRYVIIGNEPNHAVEWGNELNPEEYSDYLLAFAHALKEKSGDFFVLPAAMDASAPTNHIHLASREFIKRMVAKNQNLFDYIDGWNSHSYPNPEFSGPAADRDAISIRSYFYELEFLKSLGVTKKLPVFITETGWAHNQDNRKLRQFITPEEAGKRLTYAYENVWAKDGVVAATPFIISYLTEPFSKFSWKKPDGSFYPFYETIQNLPKSKGTPLQENKGKITAIILPDIFKRGEQEFGYAYAKNTGQTIWDKSQASIITDEKINLIIQAIYPESIEPGRSGLVYFSKLTSFQIYNSFLASEMVKWQVMSQNL